MEQGDKEENFIKKGENNGLKYGQVATLSLGASLPPHNNFYPNTEALFTVSSVIMYYPILDTRISVRPDFFIRTSS